MVGTIRLIIKAKQLPVHLRQTGLSVSSALLPCEHEFADFRSSNGSDSLTLPACEVSRYIIEHQSKSRKLKIARALHDLVCYVLIQNDVATTVAVVEEWLRRILALTGVPATRVSEDRYIERYGSDNFVVRFDVGRVREISGSTLAMPIVPAPRTTPHGKSSLPKVG